AAQSGVEGDARRGAALAVARHRWYRPRRRVLRQLRVGVRQPQDRRGRPRAADSLATVLQAQAMTRRRHLGLQVKLTVALVLIVLLPLVASAVLIDSIG